ncbi:MAG: hypothetical protein Q4P28_04645 [Tissierellia bacterium]|nr:hypothetical protein [Tissierellia bacterium]
MAGQIFPTWMWYFLPTGWIHVVVHTFLVTILFVPLVGFVVQEEYEARDILRKNLVKLYFIRLFSDLIGAFFIFTSILISFFVNEKTSFGAYFIHDLVGKMTRSPFSTVEGFLWITTGLLIAMAINYQMNKKYSFKTLRLSEKERMNMIKYSAILSSPFWFYLTEKMLYRFFTMQFIGG